VRCSATLTVSVSGLIGVIEGERAGFARVLVAGCGARRHRGRIGFGARVPAAAPGSWSGPGRSADQEKAIVTNPSLTDDTDRRCNGPVVTDLVTRARNGDRQAWDALVDRYAPLIWSICRRHRLGDADAGDVGQSVWLKPADQPGTLRDPAGLPGWLATTTRRECGRIVRAARGPRDAGHVRDAETIPDDQAQTAGQELLVAERHAALREACIHLPPCCQQLIALLIANPPLSYAEISARLGIPVGSIGPSRGRHQLRRYPAIAALINVDAETGT
jgi:RNA polymerase sigma factor (sigma-70 family)